MRKCHENINEQNGEIIVEITDEFEKILVDVARKVEESHDF